MADALLETSDLQQPYASRHSVHDEGIDNDADSLVGTLREGQGRRSSHRLEQRRASCRYFDNHPRTIPNRQVVDNDYFYQEHLKACHLSPCNPLPAPHDDTLPEEPPLRTEAPIHLIAPHLRMVRLRDKLLSSRHIRLVKLFPPGYSDGSQRHNLRPRARCLHCEVFQVSLDDISSDGQPLFAAISYACGNPTLTQHIWCGQDHIRMTQNLFDALLHIRCGDRPRLLWADGLCIDQQNTKERITKSACYMKSTARHMS
jgi:hypothetical protein